MPIFEYRCSYCNHTFELNQKETNGKELCFQCIRQAERQISGPLFVLNGKGWPGKDLKQRKPR